MGCLNSSEDFSHWFGNIHFSGPCNRACYFCIGQHMMSLDRINNLNQWPLNGVNNFIRECNEHKVTEINLTGTNTDPLLYIPAERLIYHLRDFIPNVTVGIRTNGAMVTTRRALWNMIDKASISIHSFNEVIYQKMMGSGHPPNITAIREVNPNLDLKVNIVLGPENTKGPCPDFIETLGILEKDRIKRVNLREPYGQPHIGDPLANKKWITQQGTKFGMPYYKINGLEIVYWDVHYVEVESINLYANGITSKTYPITKGHDPINGNVLGQEHFQISGRQHAQWE